MPNCPMCQNPVVTGDDVYCQNKDCTEYNIKYMAYEFNELVSDLTQIGLVVDKSISD